MSFECINAVLESDASSDSKISIITSFHLPDNISSILKSDASNESKLNMIKSIITSQTNSDLYELANVLTKKSNKKDGSGKGPPKELNMVKNNAGGYSYKIDDMKEFIRYLILGSKNTYYQTENKVKLDALSCIDRLINSGHGKEVLNTLIDVSEKGRAPKQYTTLLSLAVLSTVKDNELKKAANSAILNICRIPTHLFEFIEIRETVSKIKNNSKGWGRSFKNAICNWYLEKCQNPVNLAYLVTKYKNRNNRTHKDVFRQCHVSPFDASSSLIFSYIIHGKKALTQLITSKALPKPREVVDFKKDDNYKKVHAFLTAVEQVKEKNIDIIINNIKKYNLVREHIPTDVLNEKAIWESMLNNMPITALIRNLGTMSSHNLFTNNDNVKIVESIITDDERLSKGRVHPMNVLTAWKTYSAGKGSLGSNSWIVNKKISDTLINTTFYKSFGNVEAPTIEKTGKHPNICFCIDVSGSMGQGMGGNANPGQLSCYEGAVALSLFFRRTSDANMVFKAFTTRSDTINITKTTKLNEGINMCKELAGFMSGTDCSQGPLDALKNGENYDCFVVITDNETRRGNISTTEAIRKYRKSINPDARIAVVAMAANPFSIADPNDPGMMDFIGFDTGASKILLEFAAGRI